jgi:hypothetical protein
MNALAPDELAVYQEHGEIALLSTCRSRPTVVKLPRDETITGYAHG